MMNAGGMHARTHLSRCLRWRTCCGLSRAAVGKKPQLSRKTKFFSLLNCASKSAPVFCLRNWVGAGRFVRRFGVGSIGIGVAAGDGEKGIAVEEGVAEVFSADF
jgi:hypothetical protein